MKYLMTFHHQDEAERRRVELQQNGISSKIMVDPLDSIYPALSGYPDITLVVEESDAESAHAILAGSLRVS